MDEEIRNGVLNSVPLPYRKAYEEKVRLLPVPVIPMTCTYGVLTGRANFILLVESDGTEFHYRNL